MILCTCGFLSSLGISRIYFFIVPKQSPLRGNSIKNSSFLPVALNIAEFKTCRCSSGSGIFKESRDKIGEKCKNILLSVSVIAM